MTVQRHNPAYRFAFTRYIFRIYETIALKWLSFCY